MTAPGRILAIDIGGSGARAFAAGGPAVELPPPPAANARSRIIAAFEAAPKPDRIDAVAIGSRGAASLVPDQPALAEELARRAEAPVALAADTLTAHLGALEGRPGGVLAIGTGAIALGVDAAGRAVRIGGRGPLYDDLGSGFWLGSRALSLAVRSHEGIAVSVDATAVLSAAVARYGAPGDWPTAISPHADAIARVAAFAVDVCALADAGDPGALAIVDRGARLAAATLAGCLVRDVPAVTSAVGGVTASVAYLDALRSELIRLRPDATWVPAHGTPLDGAAILARRVVAGSAQEVPGLLWIADGPRRSPSLC